MPLVSVIIPAYNYAHFLEGCLESVFAQTHTNLEVLVINDGSTDNTDEVAARYHGRIRYVSKENGGLPSARNAGLERARGEYVLFLDADDLMAPDAIGARVRFLQANPHVDIAVCRSRSFRRSPHFDVLPMNWVLERRDLDVHLAFFNIAPPHAYLSRGSACASIGEFDVSLRACEDYDYWVRGLAAGCRFGRAPGLVYYRRHRQSMSANNQNQWTHDAILANRVFERLVEGSALRPGREVATLAAFLAGATITLERVRSYPCEDERVRLASYCTAAADSLSARLSKGFVADEVGLYYLTKLFASSSRRQLPAGAAGALRRCRQHLNTDLGAGGLSLRAMISAVGGRRLSRRARWSMARAAMAEFRAAT